MTEQPAAVLPDDVKGMRILVAEKNPALQKTILSLLHSAGAANVQSVKGGGEAWELWTRNRQIDMFVCAASLPEMPGLDLLAKLRGDPETKSQPTFLLLSADKSESAQNEAYDKGADGFLAKPFSQEQFIPKLLEALEARRTADGRHRLRHGLEHELLMSRLPVELVFDRYTTEVECEALTPVKCVIRVTNNYGLGTQLNMRFMKVGGDSDADAYYKPLKGIVMKTERIPQEIGVFRLHVQFNGPVKDQHGVPELMRHVPAPAEPA